MRKIVGKILITFLVFLVSLENVFAEDVICEYPDANLILTYKDGQEKPVVNYDDWINSDWFLNLIIVKTGKKTYTSKDFYIDQELYRSYQGNTCPDNFRVCEYSNWSVDLPSLSSIWNTGVALVEEIATIFTALAGMKNPDFSDEAHRKAYALLQVDNAEIYLLNEASYKKHEYRKYEGGLLSDDIDESAMEGWNACNKGDAWYWKVAGGICWLGWGVIDGVLLETIIGDGVSLLFYKNFTCETIKYTGENATVDTNCSLLTTGMFKYQSAIDEYKNCTTETCKSEKAKTITNQETILKKTCDNVLSNYTFNKNQTECIEQCLNLSNTLNEKKQGTALYRNWESNNANCGLSARLAAWILKIINWMRYIVPVLLILLSVLDFIKAIAADSEDEIKKVTSKFVKRLIVVVIIFIFPLALEFLLGIFGISANNFCL